jgi:hypothetical protein
MTFRHKNKRQMSGMAGKGVEPHIIVAGFLEIYNTR